MRTYRRRSTYRRDRRDQAVRYRAEGLSLRQIAAKAGVSYETVRRDLAAHDERSLAAGLTDPAAGSGYQRQMRATPGPCQMCGRDSDRQVDHCHRHVIVRGLVCPGCNCSMQIVDSEAGIVLLLIDEYAPYARRCPGCLSRVDQILHLLRHVPVPLKSTYRFKPPAVDLVRVAYEKVRPLLAGELASA